MHLCYIPLENAPAMLRAKRFRVKYSSGDYIKYLLSSHNLSINDISVVQICNASVLYSNVKAGMLCDLRDKYVIGCSLPRFGIMKRSYDPALIETTPEFVL